MQVSPDELEVFSANIQTTSSIKDTIELVKKEDYSSSPPSNFIRQEIISVLPPFLDRSLRPYLGFITGMVIGHILAGSIGSLMIGVLSALIFRRSSESEVRK